MLTQAGLPAHPAGHWKYAAPINYSHYPYYQDPESGREERILTGPSPLWVLGSVRTCQPAGHSALPWRSVKGVCSEEQGWQDAWNSPESHTWALPGPSEAMEAVRPCAQHQGWGHPVHFTPSPPRAGGAGAGKGMLPYSQPLPRSIWAVLGVSPRKRSNRSRPRVWA